ncbi:beta-ketoacyl synthase N-terminal-like domain-containing protein, partial [Priestia megaterium]|uniref:beta-ketoacyl synthase N-terminal-like domain-containing protein n=1 Tax=Priestia megaterium TaxID=1404 RepID=UPI0012D90C99
MIKKEELKKIVELVKQEKITAQESAEMISRLKSKNTINNYNEDMKFEENTMSSHKTQNTGTGGKEIAIVGISGRFPDAKNVKEFWDNLKKGKDSVKEIDRWDMDAFYHPVPQTPGKSYSKWGGFLSDVGMFDPLFFNISPKEAEFMDPQQR